MLRILDLFSGIGGFSLGLERTGYFRTIAFCEINEKARQVLKKHWPQVPIFEDVKKLRGEEVGQVDMICAGFPCQDISLAGRGAGLTGERSGLFYEIIRLAKEFIEAGSPPEYIILENVSALRSRGLEEVLRSFTEIGYDAQWHCIPASAVGAPHRRDRIWIIAYPTGTRLQVRLEAALGTPGNQKLKRQDRFGRQWWSTEPAVARVAHGLSGRMDRIKQLGNAVVPQIPELIGTAVITRHFQSVSGV